MKTDSKAPKEKKLAITLLYGKYRFLGAIHEQSVHNRGVIKGFDTWTEAKDYAAKHGYGIWE